MPEAKKGLGFRKTALTKEGSFTPARKNDQVSGGVIPPKKQLPKKVKK